MSQEAFHSGLNSTPRPLFRIIQDIQDVKSQNRYSAKAVDLLVGNANSTEWRVGKRALFVPNVVCYQRAQARKKMLLLGSLSCAISVHDMDFKDVLMSQIKVPIPLTTTHYRLSHTHAHMHV